MPAEPLRYRLRIMLVGLVLLGVLLWRTDGFTSYTYEGSRRAAVARTPAALSDWSLQTDSGALQSLHDFEDELLLVDFIYTRCPTLCQTLGSRYQRWQSRLISSGNERLRLISISIDPEFDTPARLARYRERYGGRTARWDILRPVDAATLAAIKAETGLQVIVDPVFGFAHSDALHVIRQGRLTRIVDDDDPLLDSLVDGTAALPATPP